MIYREAPEGFEPRFNIVSCFVEHDGRFVLLHRPIQKSQGGKWGVPAGKMDAGETELQAMVREMKEETGLDVQPESLKYYTKLFVRYPDYDFGYTMFSLSVDEAPNIVLSPQEHQDFRWVTPEEALTMPLVDDLDGCIKMFYPHSNS